MPSERLANAVSIATVQKTVDQSRKRSLDQLEHLLSEPIRPP